MRFSSRAYRHPARRTLRLLSGAVVATLLLSACGGDNGTEDDTPDGDEESVVEDTDADDGPEPTDPGDDAAPADDPDPADEPDPVDDEQAQPEDPSALRDLFERIGDQQTPYQVTYVLSGAFEGASDMEMVMAVDPPRTAQQTQMPDGLTRSLVTDEGIISCFQTAGDWQCWSLDDDDSFDSFLEDFEELTAEDLDFEDLDAGEVTRTTILGRDAICTTMDQTDDATVETCFDEQTGAMLRNIGSAQDGSFRMEATEFSEQPDPALFEVPAEPQPMGDLGDFGDPGDLEGLDLDDFDIESLLPEGMDLDDLN